MPLLILADRAIDRSQTLTALPNTHCSIAKRLQRNSNLSWMNVKSETKDCSCPALCIERHTKVVRYAGTQVFSAN
jgi:hypothetical protein